MYESFYKLKAKPFQLSPDPRFFFGSSGHKRVLAYLRYGINQGEGFIVVTGEVGTGKTTLLRTLLSELTSNKNVVAAQLVTTQLDADDLLRMVVASFGLPYEGCSKSAILKGLEKFLTQHAREGRRVLLIVDEAQNLPVHSLEELRMLSNFQVANKPLFQSFLIGQAEFRDTLRSDRLEQLRQRVIASYHLGPMDFDETHAYIEHRLRLVDWEQDPVFSDEAYKLIYDYSSGVPRRINTLCDRIMLVGYLDEMHEITEEIVRKVIQELRDESGASTHNPAVQTNAMQDDATSLEGEAQDRLTALEQRLSTVEDVIEKTRDLLRVLFSKPH